MVNLHANYSSAPEAVKEKLKCAASHKETETNSHVLVCPNYIQFRKERDLSDDRDMVAYFRDIMKERDKLRKE